MRYRDGFIVNYLSLWLQDSSSSSPLEDSEFPFSSPASLKSLSTTSLTSSSSFFSGAVTTISFCCLSFSSAFCYLSLFLFLLISFFLRSRSSFLLSLHLMEEMSILRMDFFDLLKFALSCCLRSFDESS